MADREGIVGVVRACERVWRSSGVSEPDAAEMRSELVQHLEAATAEGRSPDAVIGSDLEGFARAWARERIGPAPAITPEAFIRADRRRLLLYAGGAAALVAGAVTGSLAAGAGGDDGGVWRWAWTILAVAMGVGEIFTAGFFLLPFAVGAAAAAILAWLGVAVMAQWLVFFGVSLIALGYLRRFIESQDAAHQPRVGANRWAGARGMVLEDIDPDAATGMVRVENEEWRATAEYPIVAGTRVLVREVRGARLVVVPVEDA